MVSAFKTVAMAGALVGGAVLLAAGEVFKMGSKFEAMDAKAKTVFGGQITQVQAWAKANAGAMGLTAREATGLAASMGDLLVPMGFTRAEAAGMSTDMVGLSGALAEWSGGTRTAAEVASSLQKALLGEREELKGLGISITEADVKQQLMKDGTDKLTGAALAQAKALATQTLIFAKSTDAQQAFADGTAKGLRSQAEMNAKLKEVGETIITALYPAVTTIATFLATNLPGAIKFAQDAFAKIQAVIAPIAATLIPKLSTAFAWLSTNVMPTVSQAINFIATSVVPKLAAAFDWISKNILPAVGAAFSWLAKNVFPIIAAAINVIVNTVIPALARAFGWISTNVLPVLGSALRVVGGVFSTVFNAIGGVVRTISGIISTIIGALARHFGTQFATIGGHVRTASGVIGTVAQVIRTVLISIGTVLNTVATNVGTAIGRIVAAVGRAPGAIANIARRMWDSLWTNFRGVINAVIRGWNSLRFTFPGINVGPINYPSFNIGTPNIPYLHTGGIVPGSPGQNVPAMLQAGEMVTSRTQSRGPTIQVIVNGNIYGISGVDELSDRVADRLRLRGATV